MKKINILGIVYIVMTNIGQIEGFKGVESSRAVSL